MVYCFCMFMFYQESLNNSEQRTFPSFWVLLQSLRMKEWYEDSHGLFVRPLRSRAPSADPA